MVNPSGIFYALILLFSLHHLVSAQDRQTFDEAGWQQKDSMIATLYHGRAYQVVGVMIEDAYEAEKLKPEVNTEALAVFSMWQGVRHITDQNLEDAEKYLKESIDLFQSLDQPSSDRYLDALLNLADLQAQQEHADQYIATVDEALAEIEKDLTDQKELYHSVLIQAMEISTKFEFYDQAQIYGRKALRHAQVNFTNQSDEYFQALLAVGNVYLGQGETRRASNLILQAYDLAKRYLPADHLNRVYYGSNAINVLKSLGRYSAIETTYQEILEFFENNSSYKNQKIYPTLLDEMGIYYEELGDLETAYAYYDRANVLFALRVERTDPLYIQSQINVGNVLRKQKKYTESEGYYKDALQHSINLYGEKNWSEATLRENLGIIYFEMGAYQQALNERIIVKDISEFVWGPNHQEFAYSLLNLGKTYAKIGETDLAKENLETAFTKLIQLFGKNHFRVYDAAKELAVFYQDIDPKASLEKYKIASDFAIYCKQTILPLFSLSDRSELLRDFQELLSRFSSFTLKHQQHLPESVEDLQNVFINWKGSDPGPDLASLSTHFANPDENLRRHYSTWQTLRQKIINAQSLTVAEQKESDLVLSELMVQFGQLQKEMNPAFKSPLLGFEKPVGDIKRIRTKIDPDDLIIDFNEILSYDTLSQTYSSNGTYLVFLTPGRSSGTTVVKIQLNKNVLETDQLSNQSTYFDQIWRPLEPSLTDKERLFISPDGYLNKVSFYAFPTSSGKLLIDMYKVHIASNLNTLSTSETRTTSDQVLLVGAPDPYSTDTASLQNISHLMLRINPVDIASSTFRNKYSLSNASGSIGEINTLTTQFSKKKRNVVTKTGKAANKINMHQQLQENRVQLIHLSLPGFFIDSADTTLTNTNKNYISNAGLVLSGAQSSWNSDTLNKQIQDDGLLTTQEIYGLDLNGTDLIVMPLLSPDAESRGSSLAHLRNAFHIAGAKNIIYSLWPLPEKNRMVFLQLFYKNLLKSGSIDQAFTKTQLRLKKKYDARYWSGFILAS